MGRFKAKAIIVRRLPEIEVIFWDAQSVYVYTLDGKGVIFNRWFSARGSYGDYWQDFRRKMLRTKNLNLARCYELAASYDVLSIRTDRQLDLKGKKVDYRE